MTPTKIKIKVTKGFISFLMVLSPVMISAQALVPGEFEVLGLGGAGGMYTPAVSPFDPELLFVSCDMSGSYRSLDGGKSWEMIHSTQLNSSRNCRPMFTGDAIFWISNNQLRMSKDQGKTWTPVINGQAPWGNDNVTRLSYIPGEPATLFVGAGSGVYISTNGGTTWQSAVSGAGIIRGLTVEGTNVFAAIGTQLWRSLDSGVSWSVVEVPETQGKYILGLAAGTGTDSKIIYAVVSEEGLIRSTDNGENWTKVLGRTDVTEDGTNVVSDLSDILMPANQLAMAYVNNRHQIFKTENGGASWKSVFRMDSYVNPSQSALPYNVEKSWVQIELKWGYYITELGLGVNPANPDIAMVSTQGDLYMTKDGGGSWQQLMNEVVGELPGEPGIRYRSNGLEVTSSWNFLFDPYDTNRYYIAYTDIGFGRSVDQGETWIHSAKGSGNWGNTFYNVAFDPEIKGRMYASASNRHDIPHWTHINPNSPQHEGGVIMSNDHGVSWVRISNGLPHAPCTWVAVDLKSPRNQRTLYAAMFGEGIYKSVDNGQNWIKKSNGLGNAGNMHALQVQIHPVSGTLFASITAYRVDNQFNVAGGLWKSTNGGDSWVNLTGALDLKWPTYFTFHPHNPDIIYLSAATAPGASQGGLYKTTNGGVTWRRILNDADFAKKSPPSYVQTMGVQLHPRNPDFVYVASSHGVWLSTNAGNDWVWFNGIPFKSAQNVAFDPKNPEIMYVNTFGGGVWRGFYLPAGYELTVIEPDKHLSDEFVWNIFPNPNKGLFTLEITNLTEIAKIEVFNNLVIKFFEKNTPVTNDKFSKTIELHNALAGIYHVKITGSGKSVTRSVIIN